MSATREDHSLSTVVVTRRGTVNGRSVLVLQSVRLLRELLIKFGVVSAKECQVILRYAFVSLFRQA